MTNSTPFSQPAVFTTVRTYNKKPFRLEDHLERLFDSARLMEIEPGWKLEEVREQVNEALEKNTKWETKIRITLTRSSLHITLEKLDEKPDEMYENGVKLASYKGGRHKPKAKTWQNPESLAAKKNATNADAYDSVFVDEKGYVSECGYANLFWVKDGIIYTADKNVLHGVTRKVVIELAGTDKVEFVNNATLDELKRANGVFITQTTSGILPVREIDGEVIDDGRPDEVTRKLMRKFERLVRME